MRIVPPQQHPQGHGSHDFLISSPVPTSLRKSSHVFPGKVAWLGVLPVEKCLGFLAVCFGSNKASKENPARFPGSQETKGVSGCTMESVCVKPFTLPPPTLREVSLSELF